MQATTGRVKDNGVDFVDMRQALFDGLSNPLHVLEAVVPGVVLTVGDGRCVFLDADDTQASLCEWQRERARPTVGIDHALPGGITDGGLHFVPQCGGCSLRDLKEGGSPQIETNPSMKLGDRLGAFVAPPRHTNPHNRRLKPLPHFPHCNGHSIGQIVESSDYGAVGLTQAQPSGPHRAGRRWMCGHSLSQGVDGRLQGGVQQGVVVDHGHMRTAVGFVAEIRAIPVQASTIAVVPRSRP